MDFIKEYSPEDLCEIGKASFFDPDASEEEKKKGLSFIIQASKQRDPEAMYIVSRLMLDGVLTSAFGNTTEHALSLMCAAANTGCIQARAHLNSYCEKRYSNSIGAVWRRRLSSGKLVDLDGKPIRINRRGVFTPIDAELEYENGRNTLVLSANLRFLYGDEIADPEEFETAVIDGLFEWGGEYEVFGGQKLWVRIELTVDENVFDNLVVIPVTDSFSSAIQRANEVIGTKEKKQRLSEAMKSKRSFATFGLKWSVTSRKMIFVQSSDGSFSDYEEIKHVAKHEFGHALGLGDLYASETDRYEGVKTGTYEELDSYAITDKYYNLVMCDHHGPISNNDIEMVLLAFRENRFQRYQPGKIMKRISSALGKGN